MRMETYFLIADTYTLEEQSHIGYGIGCRADNSNFEDLTTDPVAVTNLISICNKLKLSPIHLADVVEDFLVDAQ